MTRLSSALGTTSQLRVKQFVFGGHTFKVRVPLVSESDAIHSRVMNPDSEAVNKIYAELIQGLNQFKGVESEELIFAEADVIVAGRSMKEAAKNKAMMETRITEMVRLLQAEDAANSLHDITYAEIEQEWPLNVQRELVEKIAEVISPVYREIRGN